MKNNHRPDLSTSHLLLLAAGFVGATVIILSWPGVPAPGSAAGQSSAALGALLLLAPLAFTIMKRSGWSASPPTWFVAHVFATLLGACLIFVHVGAGSWISPPGLVLLLLIFLLLQGSLLRALFARGYSLLFARSGIPSGFSAPARLDKAALRALIERKRALLAKLDPAADEALFSPALKHWLRHPIGSLRYQAMAEREARMVGARANAGVRLGWSRRIHLLAALGFYLGLAAHVVVVLFFAGYAADGEVIDWWHITDWGK